MSTDETVKDGLRTGLLTLQHLVSHLEEAGTLGAKEYLYCQAKLHEILKQLKHVERATQHG